ncbi:MAG: hypothetical protein U0R27_07920 [Candidatus Nanopelagicales bacterium]|jgi:hypothetical protein|nr:hypothetical protein [Actinomycetota bacterium]HNO14784.1 hypothetical protein [Actinomycetota bacterium]HUM86010.1 hypothetical protein [Actinomycetota bacterium]
MPDDLTLLRQYEPVIRYNRGELFYPCSVEDFVAGSALFRRTDDEPEELAARGSLTLDRLAELGRVHVGDIIYLQQVDGPLTRKEYKAWRKRPDRVKFKTSSRFAAVGLLSRFVDAIMRLTLLLRGRVPGGYAAAAHNAYMNTPTKDDCHYYGHVTRDGGYLVLQYWYFYSMNDWRSNFGGVNDHESDWEQVTIFLTDDEEQKPAWVAFSSHDEVGDDLRRRWDDPDIEFVDGTHPVVYAGAGSHSGAYLKGEYLITAGVPLPDWLDSVRRAFLRILPWHEDDDSGAIGIPYIDYKRGDGVAVGPGQDKPWHPVLVTDDTPWVRDYRGLWGLDTHDVFGGERAPAGVRYERKGTVRQSWGQPVAWAGLDKEAPTDEWARGDLEAARKYLTQKLADTDLELAERREALRAARAAERAQGISPQDPTPRAEELAEEVEEVRRRQMVVRQQLEGVELGLDPRPLPVEPVHAHLRHRAEPIKQDENIRGRLLRLWSAASASILLAALGMLLLFDTTGLLWPIVWIAFAMLVIEAILRRRLASLLMALLVVGLIWLGLWAAWSLFTGNLRVGFGIVLLLAAIWMAVQTAREGIRSR